MKDRSAGTVVRYNWIKGGSRLIDLVDAEDSEVLVDHPSYSTTHVYGNILIKPEAPGNSQVLHYGGDSETYADYRKGDLYFYNNTVISTRDGNTTLINLSTNEETMHLFNNVLYTTASGNYFALIDGNGIIDMNNNWIKPDWKICHCTPDGIINDLGDNIEEEGPLFADFDSQNFRPLNSSSLVGNGIEIPDFLIADHDIEMEYVKHLESIARFEYGELEIGAYENDFGLGFEQKGERNVEINLYPNPFSEYTTIHFNSELLGEYTIVISDILGREIYRKENISSNNIEIRKEELGTGLFLLTILDEKRSKQTFAKKILVE